MTFQPLSTTTDQTQTILDEQRAAGFAALSFETVDNYTTFRAEFAVDGEEDLVFHFFKSKEIAEAHTNVHAAKIEEYWKKVFPATLDATAREFFDAEFPVLKAAFTEELDSWWLRANGKAKVLDPKVLAQAFLKKMDQALDAANVSKDLF